MRLSRPKIACMAFSLLVIVPSATCRSEVLATTCPCDTCLNDPYHADGRCLANPEHFGFYFTKWRKWPERGQPADEVTTPEPIPIDIPPFEAPTADEEAEATPPIPRSDRTAAPVDRDEAPRPPDSGEATGQDDPFLDEPALPDQGFFPSGAEQLNPVASIGGTPGQAANRPAVLTESSQPSVRTQLSRPENKTFPILQAAVIQDEILSQWRASQPGNPLRASTTEHPSASHGRHLLATKVAETKTWTENTAKQDGWRVRSNPLRID